MNLQTSIKVLKCILFFVTIWGCHVAMGQNIPDLPKIGQPGGFNESDVDSALKAQKRKWTNIPPKIYKTQYRSERKHYIDTSILLSHRIINKHTWYHYLGNYGTPALNLYFHPEQNPGPQPGYAIYDAYQYQLDSVWFYNTTRPFSQFNYSLGSAQEQTVSLLHTQNINPRWNVAFEFRNINSPGFFRNQFANYNGGYISSNYISQNQRYTFRFALVQNRSRSDENGGIISDTFLTNPNIVSREQIPTLFPFQPGVYNRSVILNIFRSTEMRVDHQYRFGISDTLYNEDSTSATPRFTPRFGIRHQAYLRSTRHRFNDRFPNASRYQFIADSILFVSNDTNRNEQTLTTIENKLSFNGFIGKSGKQAAFEAGIGTRFDRLHDDLELNESTQWLTNNFLFGEVFKEALDSFQWSYSASTQLYFGGSHAGDLKVNAGISKQIPKLGGFMLGLQQTVSSAPVSYTRFATNYYVREYNFDKQSTTRLSAGLNIERLGLTLSGHSVLVGNYIYFSENNRPEHFADAFNVLQIQGAHDLKIGSYHIYSEALIQQVTGDAPVNLPLLLVRHISSFDHRIFKGKLWMTTGVEIRYHTPYATAGYNPFFNQFYYRSTDQQTNNLPELTAFLNFKVKQLRLSISGDQLQQLLDKKNIAHFPLYPMQNAMFRLGFQWILYN